MEQVAQSFVSIVRSLASSRAHDVAFIFLDERANEASQLTYAALDLHARAVACWLGACVAPGDRVMLALPPGPDYVIALLGCLYADVLAVPAFPSQAGSITSGAARLATIVRDAQPALVLTAENMAHARAADPNGWTAPPLDRDSLAYLQYTSGSTNVPRGVVLSHANLLAACAQSEQRMGTDVTSCWVGWLPLFHDFGLVGGILRPLYTGYRSVLMPPQAFLRRPIRWLEAISRYRGTVSAAPNFAYDLVVRKSNTAERAGLDLSCWQVAQNGAEPVRWATIQHFSAAFAEHGFRAEAMCPGYGLAEATLGVCTSGPREPVYVRAVPGAEETECVSCGRPYDDQRVEIVDPERRTPVADGQIGEIWVSGPNVAQGYWRRPDETSHIYQAHLEGHDAPTFLRTGDLGFRCDGHVFIRGRVKDLIVIRGRNIYAEDVEQSLQGAHPALRAGGVVAFSIRDSTTTDESLAIVAEVDSCEDAETLFARIRGVIVDDHGVRPSLVALVEPRSVPRTSSGKLQRSACRDLYLSQRIPVLAAWTPRAARSTPSTPDTAPPFSAPASIYD